jgi:hypothetical protein
LFEIKVDGKCRTYRDLKKTAVEAGKYLKQMQPQSEVSIRDVRDNSVTVIDGEQLWPLIWRRLGSGEAEHVPHRALAVIAQSLFAQKCGRR